jgi:predicted DNA binding CopG/RHH family protein
MPTAKKAQKDDSPTKNDLLWPEGREAAGERAFEQFQAELAAAHEQNERRRKIPKELLAKGRTTPIAVRFDEFTLKRLRVLAARRNTGYQTLLKEFVVERLYEEEKREGIIE